MRSRFPFAVPVAVGLLLAYGGGTARGQYYNGGPRVASYGGCYGGYAPQSAGYAAPATYGGNGYGGFAPQFRAYVILNGRLYSASAFDTGISFRNGGGYSYGGNGYSRPFANGGGGYSSGYAYGGNGNGYPRNGNGYGVPYSNGNGGYGGSYPPIPRVYESRY